MEFRTCHENDAKNRALKALFVEMAAKREVQDGKKNLHRYG